MRRRRMRIAIAGISHEALKSSPLRARMEDFELWRGEEILEAPPTRAVMKLLGCPGVAEIVQSLDVEPVPILLAATTTPNGSVEERVYLAFRDEILEGVRKAGRLDGVCLVLHGSMTVDNIWSAETDLVRSIRAVVGQDVLISARMDLHASLTEEFANKTDIWTGFRTAPHRDPRETLERAMSMLVHCHRSGLCPRPVFIRLPLLLPGERATTDEEPMRSLQAMAAEIERRPDILNAEVLVGFGWLDAPYSGSHVVVIAEDRERLPEAREEAVRLAQAMWDRREEFTLTQETAATADEAIDRALQAPESTVFISDTGDNPGAGTPGDATHFLERLLAKDVPDAVYAGIPDGEAARLCISQGVGAEVTVSLGGKLDRVHGDPVDVTGVVEHLYQPEAGSGEAAIATLRVGGVRILITDIRERFIVLDDFRRAGFEPLAHKIIVVKQGYLFPELRDAAPREIWALTPGYADQDLTRLPFKYVTRPLYPLDTDFTWHPTATNIHGYID
jgi:microcystin degradation protein MlrC